MDAQPVLAAISFDENLRAVEFMTAMTRLAQHQHLVVRDAVFVIKEAGGRVVVRETTDLETGKTALGSAMWSGLLGLLLGGPVGMLVAGGLGAAGGAIAAKFVDIGVSDEFVDQLRAMVQPGTTTLALLADRVDTEAVLAELARFEGARYVAGNLPLDTIRRVREAIGDPTAMTGDPLPAPTLDDRAE
jgi:uncharacterized membrane protein